jgi:hypothetical protein
MGMQNALNSRMETTDKQIASEPLWRSVFESYRALPAWQKAIVVASSIMTSPFLLLLFAVSAASMFPFFLLGRFEGDEDQSISHEAARLLRKQHLRTEHAYAG